MKRRNGIELLVYSPDSNVIKIKVDKNKLKRKRRWIITLFARWQWLLRVYGFEHRRN